MPNTSASGGYLTPTSAPLVEDSELDAIFTAAILGITGLPLGLVRPRWQPKPPLQPAGNVNWCAFGITTDETDAHGAVLQHDPAADGGNGQDNYQRQTAITLLASFYGPNGKGFAELMRDGLAVPQNREELQLNSIAYVTAGTIRAVPESVNMQWIKRYDLELSFRRQIDRTYAVQNILSVEIQAEICDVTTEIIVSGD